MFSHFKFLPRPVKYLTFSYTIEFRSPRRRRLFVTRLFIRNYFQVVKKFVQYYYQLVLVIQIDSCLGTKNVYKPHRKEPNLNHQVSDSQNIGRMVAFCKTIFQTRNEVEKSSMFSLHTRIKKKLNYQYPLPEWNILNKNYQTPETLFQEDYLQ